MDTFTLYIIHTQSLQSRQNRLHSTIQLIRDIASSANYDFRSVMILHPDPADMDGTLKQFDQRIKYDVPLNDSDFESCKTMLNVQQLSNFEKHRVAWKRMQEISDKDTQANPTAKQIHMVIEDDTILIGNMADNFREAVQILREKEYDFITCTLSDAQAAATMPQELIPLSALSSKILPGKDSYFVNPTFTRHLLDKTETITFTMKHQISHILYNARSEKKLFSFRKRITLEASKLGFCPSTINPNNTLLYNQEYMELLQMLSMEEVPIAQVRKVYKSIQHINSPDMMHLYGILLFKSGAHRDAEEALSNAVKEAIAQQGLITNQSDLLNNLLNVYEFLQHDLKDLQKQPSKYESILKVKA